MIKLAVIGLGKMGLSHFAIANTLNEFRVTAVSDLSQLVGKSVARFTGARFARDYRGLVLDRDVDAILISVPTHLHFPVAEAALQQGKHVFLEKPLTLAAETSRALAEQARQAGLATQVGYVNRFNPVLDHFRSLVAEKTYGAPVSYECIMRGNVVGDNGAQGWRNQHGSGGGCLYEYGSHCIDLSLFLFGSLASLNSATLEHRVSSNVEDLVDARITHDSGVQGRLVIDWADKRYRKATNIVHLQTEAALLSATKQEITVFMNPPNALDEAIRWSADRGPDHRINITDLNTDVPYYLRGEDFTRQLIGFHDLIKGSTSGSAAQFADGYETDRLISDIFAMGSQ